MLKVLKKWYERHFHDEQAVVLLLLLLVLTAVIIFFGGILAPFIAALVLAFLLQGVVFQLERLNCPHLLAVSLSSAFLVLLLIIGLIIVLPLALDQLTNLVLSLIHI